MDATQTPQDFMFGTEGVAGVKSEGRNRERRPVDSRLLRAVAESGDVVAAATEYEPQQDAAGKIKTFSFVFRPFQPAPALENGRRLLALVTDSVESDRGRQARLPFLLWQFGGVALRVAAVHEYLHELRRRGGNRVARALGLGGGRGRPPDYTRLMHTVALIDWFAERRSLSVSKAAEVVHRVWEPAGSCTVERLRTVHSEIGELARINRGGYFVPAAVLEPYRWRLDEPLWSMFV